MDISIIVAKVLGVYLIISGLFLIFKGKTVPQLLKDLFDHPAISFLAGVILVFLSTLVLIQNNIWDGTWRTIITIIVWSILLKGLAYIFAPKILQNMISKKVLESINLYGLIILVFGVCLFFIG